MAIPAIVAAGDRGAAKSVYGESKVFLEVAGRALVARVVDALQRAPEVSEIWVVGNAERLRAVLPSSPAVEVEAGAEVEAKAGRKPLHVVPQLGSLLENGWETFRRLLPGAGPEGRDPGPEDADVAVLYLSGDLPLATPEEISAFVRQGLERDCAYALGLVTEESMAGFLPAAPGEPGVEPAFFNLREGRFRQSNLHLLRPARIGNRSAIQEMYVNRHQREWSDAAGLAWRLLRNEQGGLSGLWYYALMHVAGLAHRRGWHRLADRIRRWIPAARIERGVGALIGGSFSLVVTEAGGCAFDVDNEAEYDAVQARFEVWEKSQRERARRLYGPV